MYGKNLDNDLCHLFQSIDNEPSVALPLHPRFVILRGLLLVSAKRIECRVKLAHVTKPHSN